MTEIMECRVPEIREQTIEKVLAKQDASFRWGFDERQTRECPEYLYYSPNFRSTLWTLILLADLKAPAELPQIQASIRLITEWFYDPETGIFGLPGRIRFPIPCLNGNMIYLHNYFRTSQTQKLESTIDFFATYQRFDDGDFKTPKSHPYCSNRYCYGRHTCYWGVIKLLKGISSIPKAHRSGSTQQLIDNCIDFVLRHQVCFNSHHLDGFIHRDIGELTFPNFYKSDFLEILWLLAREGVQDGRISRSLDLLRSKMKDGGYWALEKSMNTVVPTGQKGCANAFITERAIDVLRYF